MGTHSEARERIIRTGLCDCGHAPTAGDGPGTGYGVSNEGQSKCYACCAEQDREIMRRGEPIALYLVDSNASTGRSWSIQNWPGSLVIEPYRVRKGRHNIGRTRFDVWFSFEGRAWHGVNIGDNQIVRCRALKV